MCLPSPPRRHNHTTTIWSMECIQVHEGDTYLKGCTSLASVTNPLLLAWLWCVLKGMKTRRSIRNMRQICRACNWWLNVEGSSYSNSIPWISTHLRTGARCMLLSPLSPCDAMGAGILELYHNREAIKDIPSQFNCLYCKFLQAFKCVCHVSRVTWG